MRKVWPAENLAILSSGPEPTRWSLAHLQGMQPAALSLSAMRSERAQEVGARLLVSAAAKSTPEAGRAEIVSQEQQEHQ